MACLDLEVFLFLRVCRMVSISTRGQASIEGLTVVKPRDVSIHGSYLGKKEGMYRIEIKY